MLRCASNKTTTVKEIMPIKVSMLLHKALYSMAMPISLIFKKIIAELATKVFNFLARNIPLSD